MKFDTLEQVAHALAGRMESAALYDLWHSRQPVTKGGDRTGRANPGQLAWLHDPELAAQFTRCALEVEEFLLVCDAADEALRLDSDGRPAEDQHHFAEVRVNYARALTRIGATAPARLQVTGLLDPARNQQLPKRLRAKISVVLGNVEREESRHAAGAAGRARRLERALDHYRNALSIDARQIDAAIHAAGMLLLLGRSTEAEEQARRTLGICDELEAAGEAEDANFTVIVTRAAAYAVLGQLDEARAIYTTLSSLTGISTRQLSEARYRARLLAAARGERGGFFDDCFPALQLIVFAGHLPDAPGACTRFPASRMEEVRGLIRAKLEKLNARVGLVGASAGADLIFIEEMLARGGTVHVVLPWSREEYLNTSVRPFDGGDDPSWESRFHEALRNAATVRELGQVYRPTDGVAWRYTMEITAGLAHLTAQASRLDVHPLVLWDRRPGLAGGTAEFHAFWKDLQQREPEVIELTSAIPGGAVELPETETPRSERDILRQEVKTMLFADIVGYSKLAEHVIPTFVREFLGRVSECIAASRHAPISVNTWGDAIYAVFDRAESAGCFALEIVQMVAEGAERWRSAGLTWQDPVSHEARPLNVRVGLHTGPVYVHFNPVVRTIGFTGAHVNRAARIEPVTEAGNIFASEEFVALAALNRAQGFVCEFAGTMSLAKNFPGTHRIYRLLPRRALPVEELAEAVHNLYIRESRARGETTATNSALCPWSELPEILRESNRAQAEDIPNVLNVLGLELVQGAGMRADDILITDAQVEQLAIRQHERYVQERLKNGWTFGPVRDNATRKHPLLIPWEKLDESEKEKDRDTVRNVPKLIALAGFRVRPLADAESR